jgi:hypothetical protein
MTIAARRLALAGAGTFAVWTVVAQRRIAFQSRLEFWQGSQRGKSIREDHEE